MQAASQLPEGVSAYMAALQKLSAVVGGIKKGLAGKSLTAVLSVFATDASAASTSRPPLPVPGVHVYCEIYGLGRRDLCVVLGVFAANALVAAIRQAQAYVK